MSNPMTNEELDKFIHEEVMGKHYHAGTTRDGTTLCRNYSKCKAIAPFYNPTYLEHNEHWGELLNWAMKQEWWGGFICLYGAVKKRRNPIYGGDLEFLPVEDIANPRSLPEHIAEYLEGLKDG